jgi:toxin ParE1/3/4
MQNLKVCYRPTALTDLEDIFNVVLTVSKNPVTANRFITRLLRRCDRIGIVPRGGRPRDDLETGLRTVPFEHTAIIAYKVENERVEIANIFYGGRDYQTFYLGRLENDPESAPEE